MSDALILLHFQNDICHRDGRIPFAIDRRTTADAFLSSSRAALSAGRAARATIIHIHIAFAEDYSDLPLNCHLFRALAEAGAVKRGSWGAAALAGFEPSDGEFLLTHNRSSGFRNSGLEDVLQKHGITRLTVMGLATHFTVEHTVRDATDLGYLVRVLADCCSSADPEAHRASLRTMAKLAEIVQSGL